MAPLLNACMSLSKRRLKPKLIFTVFVLVLDLGPTLLVLQNVLPCDARISLWLVYARHTFLFRCCVVVRYRKRLQARDELLALPCCTFNGNGQGRVILTEERVVVSAERIGGGAVWGLCDLLVLWSGLRRRELEACRSSPLTSNIEMDPPMRRCGGSTPNNIHFRAREYLVQVAFALCSLLLNVYRVLYNSSSPILRIEHWIWCLPRGRRYFGGIGLSC